MVVINIILQSFLGVSALISAVLGATFYRETKRQRRALASKAEIDVRKAEQETAEMASKAAQLDETRERERETWWQEQFLTARHEFATERQLSAERFVRIIVLERYIDSLLRYVGSMLSRLRQYESNVVDPPTPPVGGWTCDDEISTR